MTKLRAAPVDVRSDAGHELELVQRGEAPTDFRPMPDVGPGAMEIRVHGENEFRVFYVARFEEAIYVLHCFVKKTRTTSKGDLSLGRKRFAEVAARRRELR